MEFEAYLLINLGSKKILDWDWEPYIYEIGF